MKHGYEQNNNSKSLFYRCKWIEESLAAIHIGLLGKNEN